MVAAELPPGDRLRGYARFLSRSTNAGEALKRITAKSLSAAGLLLTLVAGLAFASAPASAVTAGDELTKEAPAVSYAPQTHLSGEGAWTDEMYLSTTTGAEAISEEEIAETLKATEQALKNLPQNRNSGPITIVDSAAPALPFTQTKVSGVVYPATVGKLLSLTPNGKKFNCTAAVINSEGKNLVYTAAHCVYNKKHDGQKEDFGPDGWHSNFEFIPAYHVKDYNTVNPKPQNPYGKWYPELVVTFDAWMEDHNRAFDQAFILMDSNASGFEIADVVGGNGMTYNENQAQYPVEVWGYPVADPYDTQTHKPHRCLHGQTTASNEVVPNGMRVMCDMTGGSSGGPWIKSLINKNRGTVIAVTSGRVTGAGATMHGAPNTTFTADLYDDMKAG